MRCPHCSYEESKVIDSRDAPDGIRRRRECIKCGLRFTTYERIQTTSLMIAKRDGRREEYQKDKLTNSIRMACVKRPLPTGTIDKLVEDIETQLHDLGKSEITSAGLGEIVINRLRVMDPVAYIRFVSVYRDFADVESFKDAVEALETAHRNTNASTEKISPQLPLIKEEIKTVSRSRGRRVRISPAIPMDLGN
jgi:transcriptional repressor NrdR